MAYKIPIVAAINGRRFDPPLLQSFGWDFKPKSRLHDLVVSGALTKNTTTTF